MNPANATSAALLARQDLEPALPQRQVHTASTLTEEVDSEILQPYEGSSSWSTGTAVGAVNSFGCGNTK
jgi:predicted  nucleic acid-binding Zn-ribbon protein